MSAPGPRMTARPGGDLDYACARIGARYGAHPDAATWLRIETVRELAAMLDAARATALRPWTAGLSADAEPHAIERVLRAHWRSLAAEVAAWMPERWQPALAWSALAVDLVAIDHLRRGAQAPQWLQDDAVYREWTAAAPGPMRALASDGDTDALMRAWRDEWRRRLPHSHATEAPLLGALSRTLARHAEAMRAAPPGDASPLVRALRERLEALYRRAVLEPTAAFVYLGLTALDFARLRGEIMRRALFPRLAPAP